MATGRVSLAAVADVLSGVLLKIEGYTQRGVAKGLKVPCLFMITEVSIRCPKKTRRLVYGVYPRIPPNTLLDVL